MSDPNAAEEKAGTTSLGDLLGGVTRELSTLFRQEVELAKVELTESAKRAGKGAGMMGAAAHAAIMAVLFLSIAAMWGLGYLIGVGWSSLVVFAVWAIIGLILFVIGQASMKSVRGAPQTVAPAKENPETLTRGAQR